MKYVCRIRTRLMHMCVNVSVCAGCCLFFDKNLSKATAFSMLGIGSGCWSSRATTSFGLVSWAWPGAQMGWRWMGQPLHQNGSKIGLQTSTEMKVWKPWWFLLEGSWRSQVKSKTWSHDTHKFQRMEATRVKNGRICQPPGFNRSPWSLSREACHELSKTLARNVIPKTSRAESPVRSMKVPKNIRRIRCWSCWSCWSSISESWGLGCPASLPKRLSRDQGDQRWRWDAMMPPHFPKSSMVFFQGSQKGSKGF